MMFFDFYTYSFDFSADGGLFSLRNMSPKKAVFFALSYECYTDYAGNDSNQTSIISALNKDAPC